ncbi:hypothetical protein Tco_1252806 [Tanacetum coccineum]
MGISLSHISISLSTLPTFLPLVDHTRHHFVSFELIRDGQSVESVMRKEIYTTLDNGVREKRELCIDVLEYQVLTREIEPTLKPLKKLSGKMSFVWGVIGIMFLHVFFICFIVSYTPKDSTLPISWQNKWSRENPKLDNESYVLYDRVMNPLAAQLERKPRRDRGTRRGRHSTSSSSVVDQPSSSHLNNDDDDGNNEGTSRATILISSPMFLK